MHSRHLTLGSLALVAVLGTGSGLLAAAAAVPGTPSLPGDAHGCGQPEVPAQWGSVEHPAVTRPVPAVTRTEWRWQRAVGTLEREYARESVAAVVLVHWTRDVAVTEREHTWTVVDSPARPGSPEEGHHETQAAVPAEPELSHVETAWFADGTTPPAGAMPTGRTRDVPSGAEETDLPVGVQPAGDGWVEGAPAEISAAEEERIWLPDGTAPDPGFVATGATRTGVPRLESTSVTSAQPPAGDGWTELPGSSVEVVVAAAGEVVLEPAWVEDFVLVPGQPATPPCAEAAVPTALPVVALPTGAVAPATATAPGAGRGPATAVLPGSALPASGA